MPYKCPEKRREANKRYSAKYYANNKSKVIAATNRNKTKHAKGFRAYKATLSCVKCGENHPAALDFHHTIRHPENRKISELTRERKYAEAMKEIEEKCIVLCANCHRKHHYEENKK